jgi:dTDP-4-dehydrorhamnose reductase
MNLSLLVPGAAGQLGRDLVAAAARAGITRIHAPDSAQLDVTNPATVFDVVEAASSLGSSSSSGSSRSLSQRLSSGDGRPRLVVINAAAFTAVDAAEQEGAAQAQAVNAEGPANLARACAAHQAHLIQVSTDYVFAGNSAGPHKVDSPTVPGTVYGRTKLAGERAVLSSGASAHVVRTAWLYGAHGTNFVRTMAALARERETIRVVDDQHGNPTWTADLADGLIALALAVDRVPVGVLHCANTAATTWFALAKAVFTELGADPDRVQPCRTADFPRPAPRPANSVLDTTGWVAAGLPGLRHWRRALHAAVAAGVTLAD